jgi:hypothetical protein
VENWTFETVSVDKGIWIHSQYGGQDAACGFIQHLLQKFQFAGGVTFEWSYDCTKPLPDDCVLESALVGFKCRLDNQVVFFGPVVESLFFGFGAVDSFSVQFIMRRYWSSASLDVIGCLSGQSVHPASFGFGF